MKLKEKIREALAEYMASEGCSCCESFEEHDKAKEKLAKLLDVDMYIDKSGYDFMKYKPK